MCLSPCQRLPKGKDVAAVTVGTLGSLLRPPFTQPRPASPSHVGRVDPVVSGSLQQERSLGWAPRSPGHEATLPACDGQRVSALGRAARGGRACSVRPGAQAASLRADPTIAGLSGRYKLRLGPKRQSPPPGRASLERAAPGRLLGARPDRLSFASQAPGLLLGAHASVVRAPRGWRAGCCHPEPLRSPSLAKTCLGRPQETSVNRVDKTMSLIPGHSEVPALRVRFQEQSPHGRRVWGPVFITKSLEDTMLFSTLLTWPRSRSAHRCPVPDPRIPLPPEGCSCATLPTEASAPTPLIGEANEVDPGLRCCLPSPSCVCARGLCGLR